MKVTWPETKEEREAREAHEREQAAEPDPQKRKRFVYPDLRANSDKLVENMIGTLNDKRLRMEEEARQSEPSSSERFHRRASRVFKRREGASAPRELPPRFNPASQRFKDALVLAAEIHAGQIRKGTDIPYLAHLLGVASIAIEYGADEDEAVAALLHDAPEDCGGRPTLDMIRGRFGDAVAAIVEGCTDTFEDPKPDWKERKPAYIARIPKESDSVRLVSASDKLHNARSILMDYRAVGGAVFDRFKKETSYHTLWYYRRLADAFLAADHSSPLFQELNRVVTKVEQKVIERDGAGGVAEQERVYREMDGNIMV